MKSLIFTFLYTKKGLNLLDEEFEDDLYNRSILIFCIYGVISFLFNFEQQSHKFWFFTNLFELIISILLSLIIGMLSSYILYKTGKLLKAESSLVEIFSLFSYSFVSIIIGLLVSEFLKKTEFDSNFVNSIWFLSYFFSIKILFQGLLKFNKYGVKKTLFNLSIFIGFIIGIVHLIR